MLTTASGGRPRPAPMLRFAALAQAFTALALAEQWSRCEGVTSLVLIGTFMFCSLASAWALWLRDSFETKVVVAVTALATGVGGLLSLTVGMPGWRGGEVSVPHAVLFAFPCLVLVLLALDTRRRTRSSDV